MHLIRAEVDLNNRDKTVKKQYVGSAIFDLLYILLMQDDKVKKDVVAIDALETEEAQFKKVIAELAKIKGTEAFNKAVDDIVIYHRAHEIPAGSIEELSI